MSSRPGPTRRPLLRLATAIQLLAALAVSASVAAQPATIPDFPLAAVAAGMSGYALTTGPGDVIESFPVEVVGVQFDAVPGLDLVLIRVSGPFIEASGGVAAGMSGSPVYLVSEAQPALLGAIGYVFPNADHNLALVTPIAAMRNESADAGRVSALEVQGYGRAVAVATPLLLSGSGERAAALLAPLFRDGSVSPFPIQASGGGLPTPHDFKLVPGAAIAVQLLSGAVELSAVGTVTAVEGTRLLALGHPFLGLGAVSFGLAPAHVTTIVSSSVVPFKLANVGTGSLGAVVLDAPAAVAAVVGARPDTVPVTITLDTGTRQETFEVLVAADERLYPTLTAVATLQLIDRLLRKSSAGHAELAWEIELGSDGRLNMLEQIDSDTDVALASARLAGGPLAILATNAFQAPTVTAIDLSVTLTTEPNYATVESLVLEEKTVAAGAHAIVHVRLQPYRRQAIVRTFSVPLPDSLSGDVTLLVRGGDVPREIEDVPAEGGEVDEPRSFFELLEALREQLQASELVIESVDAEGDIRRLLRIALPFVVHGSQEVTLSVTSAPAVPAGEPADQPEAAPLGAEEEHTDEAQQDTGGGSGG